MVLLPDILKKHPFIISLIMLSLSLFACNGIDGGGVSNSQIDEDSGQFSPTYFGPALSQQRAADVAWGDVDGDGDLDLALATVLGSESRLYLNEGSNTFTICDIENSRFSAQAIAWGDVDGDGKLDLAIGNSGGENYIFGELKVHIEDDACILQNNRVPIPDSIGTKTLDLSWGDFNGDGFLDLAVANKNSVNQLYKNDGSGSLLLEDGNPLGTHEYDSTSLAWGDYDNDGDLDLAIGNNGHPIELFEYTLDGFIIREGLFGSTGSTTTSLGWGDINGDTHLDLVEGVHTDQSIVWINNLSQTNRFFIKQLIPGTEHRRTNDLAIADVNRDGFLDIVLANGDKSEFLEYYRNYYRENFADKSFASSYQTGWTSFPEEENQLFLNDGSGNFNETSIYPSLSHSQNSLSIALGDMDGDGDLDLAEGSGHWSNMVAENVGVLSFAFREESTEVFHSRNWYIAPGDINNDGFIDLALDDGIYLNRFGAFERIQTIPNDKSYGYMSTNKTWADINNDGYLDLITTRGRTYLNDGTGHLQEIVDNGIDWSIKLAGWESSAIAVEYLNDDPWIDIIFHSVDSTKPPVIYYNRPENEGSALTKLVFDEVLLPEGYQALRSHHILTGDLNGDGLVDIFFSDLNGYNDTNQYQGSVIFFNDGHGFINGEGEFTYSEEPYQFRDSGGQSHAKAVEIADFDSDSDLDIVLASVSDRFFENDGSGKFTYISDAFQPSVTAGTLGLASGDIDLDGDIDLIFADTYTSGSTLSSFQPNNAVYINKGNGQFDLAPKGTLSHNDDSYAVELVDIDNDGDLDSIFGSFNAGSYWYENLRINQATVNNRPPTVYIGHPNDQSILTTSYIPLTKLEGRVIPISYQLFSQERDVVTAIRAEYSLNGGADWKQAIPTSITDTFKLNTFDESLFFDGASGYVQISHDDILNIEDVFTIEMWFYPLFHSETRTLIQKTDAFAIRRNEEGKLEWMLSDMNGWRRTNEVAPEGKWSHVALTYNETSKGAKIFLNGALIDSTVFLQELVFTSIEDLTIGYPAGNLSATDQPFHGFIRDVRYWNNVRSKQDIEDHLYSQFNAETDGLVGYWPLNNIESSQTNDLSGNENHGILGTGSTGNLPELARIGADHLFLWDTFGSGFFGESENVLFRIQAFPQLEAKYSLPPATIIRYPNQTVDSIPWSYTSSSSFPFRARGTQIRVIDEAGNGIDKAIVFHRSSAQEPEATILVNGVGIPLETNSQGFLGGRPEISAGGQLIALWPVPDAELNELLPPDFTDSYTLFYTSKRDAETNQIPFQDVSIQEDTVTQPITISHESKLLLFHLNVSLEWDARNDPLFLLELEESFKEASAILYDVTDGQVALEQINLFHNKAYWGNADVVIYADNSLRPSAAIGGIVSDTIKLENPDTNITEIYGPGQVRMGTVWDTFGERTADLGEEWTRALAHELAHYLLFLPDNYLGIDEDKFLQPIDCPGSFMTNNSDPDYSEFLPDTGVSGVWHNSPCNITLAERTTERADWETVEEFYPFLDSLQTDEGFDGPAFLPMAVTYLVPWAFDLEPNQGQTILPSRNYLIRNSNEDEQPVIRLPNAQLYLFKTVGTENITDDLIIPLGSPTGGGNRIRIRGAEVGDRVCLIDASTSSQGCELISLSQASIGVTMAEMWQPEISIHSADGITVNITVTQAITNPSGQLKVQMYPLHYQGIPNLDSAPTKSLVSTNNLVHTATLMLPLPAYEIAARVWITESVPSPLESVSVLRINPANWDSELISTMISTTIGATEFITSHVPIFGPISTPTGGPISTPTGGPISTPTGGPNDVPFSGPISTPTGGPISTPTGGPISTPTGGPLSFNAGAVRSAYAPILSADAQIVIYNTEGFFEDNGILSLQLLPNVPEIDQHQWLIPVGQAYHVQSNSEITDTRFISFNYLQRDVPDGYEHTLTIYFLEDCPAENPECMRKWHRIPETKLFTGNIVAAPLQTAGQTVGTEAVNGAYAVMATVEMPPMDPGWNLFAYNMPNCRSWEVALDSIIDSIDVDGNNSPIKQANGNMNPDDIVESVEVFQPGHVYWVPIKDGHTDVVPFLAPPEHNPDGTFDDNCD